MSAQQKKFVWMLIPVMFSFFAMGFVDLVGIATNYVKADFELTDKTANLLPSMVFFWFLVCAVPTGILMNKIGQRKTVFFALSATPIQENVSKDVEKSTFKGCFALLADKVVLLSFLGIICHVGIDVGINVTAPKLLMERLDMTLEGAGLATSVYFLFRTIGCFSGAFFLAYIPTKRVFAASVLMMLAAIAGLFTLQTQMALYVCIALIGLGNSNIFPMLLSRAMLHLPERKNEVSGLMIMGLFGGTIFPMLMGYVSDAMGSQIGAIAVLAIGVFYLLCMIPVLNKDA